MSLGHTTSTTRRSLPVGLIRRAHPLDVGEHPRLNSELNSACKGSGDDLTPEHGARRDLHVMSELHVRSEGQRLGHRDVTVGLEQHHGLVAERSVISTTQSYADVNVQWAFQAASSR